MQISTLKLWRNIRIAAFVLIALADIFVVYNAVVMSVHYPFDRIALENRLNFSFVLFDRSDLRDATVVADSAVSHSGDIKKARFPEGMNYVVLKNPDSSMMTVTFYRNFNYELVSFVILLLLIANIHLIWGILVAKVKMIHRFSLYYSWFSLASGGIHFSLCLLVFSDLAAWGILVCSAMMGALALWMILDLSLKNRRKNIIATVSIFILILAGFAFLSANASLKTLLFYSIFPVLVFFPILVLFFSLTSRKGKRNLLRVIPMSLFVFSGIGVPAIIYTWSFVADAILPVYAGYALTLIFPMAIGSSLIVGSNGYILSMKKKYVMGLFTDLFAAAAIALVGYYIVAFYSKRISTALIIVGAFFCVVVILSIRYVMKKTISEFVYSSRGEYVQSLRTIAVLSAEASDLNYKLARIYIEVFRTMAINQLRLVMKSDKLKNSKIKLDSYVSYYSDDLPVALFYAGSRSILRKDSLYSSELFRSLVEGFPDAHNFYVILPFLSRNVPAGAIFAGEKRDGSDFDDEDMRYLNSAAFMIMQMIDNEIMLSDYMEKVSHEEELDNASFMQMRFFPKTIPQDASFDLAYYTRPYIKLMGDYFDYIRINDTKTAFVVADVTGHGMPAAMIVTVTSMIFHSIISSGQPIENVVHEINNFLTSRYSGIELITMLIGVYNSDTRSFSYINAGHCEPVIFRRGVKGYSMLTEGSYMLGVDPKAQYSSSTYSFEKGDYLVLYTDGLPDIHDTRKGEDLGNSVFSAVSRDDLRSTESALESLVSHVTAARPGEIKDDITIAVIRFE